MKRIRPGMTEFELERYVIKTFELNFFANLSLPERTPRETSCDESPLLRGGHQLDYDIVVMERS